MANAAIVNAERYDRAYAAGHGRLDYPPEWLVRWVALTAPRPGQFFDYGFGWGAGARYLLAQGWSGAGVETSATAVAHLQGTPGWRGLVVAPDATAVPVASGICDLVLANQVLYYLAPAQRAAILAEFRRLLRPGGEALMTLMSPANYYIAERGTPTGEPDTYTVTLPERLGGGVEVIWAPPRTALAAVFAGWRLEVGFYDAAYFGKGRNHHWLVRAWPMERR